MSEPLPPSRRRRLRPAVDRTRAGRRQALLLLAAALLALAPAAAGLAAAAAEAGPREPLAVRTREGAVHRFAVEVARTPDARARGLMFRDAMAPEHGMLFDFGEDQPVSMWMRNTLIPLDMVFVEASGRIAGVAPDAVPLSERVIPSPGPVRAVLELNAGTARRLGIRRGDTVLHPLFGTFPGG